MPGVAITVKVEPALVRVFCLTVRLWLPGFAFDGMTACSEVEVQVVAETVNPDPVTCGAESYEFPKLVPFIVSVVPAAPLGGEMLVMVGVACTLKLIPLLATPFTVTTIGPLVAPVGTYA